jgi:hypothetical protein
MYIKFWGKPNEKQKKGVIFTLLTIERPLTLT